ncbi:hypothetical protein J4Q44_G00349950 [Coregonus suidteri]|uniref:Uncharacterized protein n=1 Tax=Coregonus suidteri TaxID=861788 RepID=A0AAN8KRP6_9TELE
MQADTWERARQVPQSIKTESVFTETSRFADETAILGHENRSADIFIKEESDRQSGVIEQASDSENNQCSLDTGNRMSFTGSKCMKVFTGDANVFPAAVSLNLHGVIVPSLCWTELFKLFSSENLKALKWRRRTPSTGAVACSRTATLEEESSQSR